MKLNILISEFTIWKTLTFYNNKKRLIGKLLIYVCLLLGSKNYIMISKNRRLKVYTTFSHWIKTKKEEGV